MKGIVYIKNYCFQGVYSNKKNLWNVLEHEQQNKLLIKLNPVKTTELTYPKVVKHLKERTMLRIYKEDDVVNYRNDDNIEECPSYINLYEVEINKPYKLKENNE